MEPSKQKPESQCAFCGKELGYDSLIINCRKGGMKYLDKGGRAHFDCYIETVALKMIEENTGHNND